MDEIKKLVPRIESLLQGLSLESMDKARYAERVSRYRKECGCSSGGIFAAIAMVIFTVYIIFGSYPIGLDTFSYGFIFIMLSSALGKLSGIGIARIKLILLYKFLLKQKE